MDLTDEQSIMKAVEGCDYIVHTAAPAILHLLKEEEEMLKPAIDGTKSIMKAALQHKCKRVVYTSSMASSYVRKEYNN